MKMKSLLVTACLMGLMISKASEAQAAIIYIDFAPDSLINLPASSTNNRAPMDFNGDAVADLWVRIDVISNIPFIHLAGPLTGAIGYVYATNPASDVVPFSQSTLIGPSPAASGTWTLANQYPVNFLEVSMLNQGDRYAAVRIANGTNFNYGWVHLNVSGSFPNITTTIKGFAYETLVNTPIAAGNTGNNISQPTAVTNNASTISSSGAQLNGTVNANGSSTTITFEYGLTTAYGTTASATPGTLNGNVATPVSATVSSLLPATTYHYRVKAVNSSGTAYGSDNTFTTLNTQTPSPIATTLPASGITASGATLNGQVNALGSLTTVTFEYGLTAAYGSIANAVPPTVNGTVLTNVSANLTGLQPITIYHYRIKAVNAAGTSYSPDAVLTTTSSTSIPVVNNNNKIYTINPNPVAQDHFRIEGPASNLFPDVTLWNGAGKRVITVNKYRVGEPVDISNLPAGFYIVEISGYPKSTERLKLLKSQ